MIGGKTAKPGLFPFMAFLTWNAGGNMAHCSGFIVSPTAIMAAAHCLHSSPTDTLLKANYTAHVGNVDRKKGKVVKLEAFIHPKYNRNLHSNDISILKPLNGGKLPLGKDVKPIPLEGKFVQPKHALAMGWGRTTIKSCVDAKSQEDLPKKLLYHWQKVHKVGKRNIRVKGSKAAKSRTCMGDSGSPLVEKRKGEFVAIGILSTGGDNADERYTRILGQKSFILKHAKDVKFVK